MIFLDHSWSFPILNNISFANKYIFSLRTNLVTFHQKCLLFNPWCKHMLNWWLSSSLGLSMPSYPSASPRLSSQSSNFIPNQPLIFNLHFHPDQMIVFISTFQLCCSAPCQVQCHHCGRFQVSFDLKTLLIVWLFRGCRREKRHNCFLFFFKKKFRNHMCTYM